MACLLAHTLDTISYTLCDPLNRPKYFVCHGQHCRNNTCATTRRAASVYALFNYCSMAAWLTCYCGAFMPRDAVLHMQCYNSLACNVCERGTYLSLVALRVASVAAQGPHPATCGVIWSDHTAHLAAATACRQPSAPFSLSDHFLLFISETGYSVLTCLMRCRSKNANWVVHFTTLLRLLLTNL